MNYENLEEEILTTRVGGFGSSDAKMIANIGRRGFVAERDKKRIAVMLGIDVQAPFTTDAIVNGKKREREIFEYMCQIIVDNVIIANEYLEHTISEDYDFKIFTHIDIRNNALDTIQFYEIKTSKFDFDILKHHYKEQMCWHNWIINNCCENTCKSNYELFLMHYPVDDNNINADFNFANINYIRLDSFIDKVEYDLIISNFEKGLKIIQESLQAILENYKPAVELTANDLSYSMQEEINHQIENLRQIKILQQKVDDFKKSILQNIENKSLTQWKYKDEQISISYTNKSVSQIFDSRKFQSDYPALYNEYLKSSSKQSSMRIQLMEV
jgi:hypothetical protein